MTLVYLAAQVRQSAQAQQIANELAKADALHRSTEGFRAFRTMVIDAGVNAVWVKAQRDAELTPEDEQQLFWVVQELAFSAMAAGAIQQAAGATATAQTIPEVVARVIRPSAALRRVWSLIADDLVEAGFDDFAAAVSERVPATEVA